MALRVEVCHLPKWYTIGFGMVFKFFGQQLKQSNVFGYKIKRFGVNGQNSCQEVKVKLDPSIKIGQCLNILVLLQNKCVLDARWPMESCAESSFGHFSSRSVGKICTSGKICQWSCVGFGYRLQHTHRHLISPTPNSIRWDMFPFICQEFAFIIDVLIIFLYLLVQILWKKRPEIKNFQALASSLHWCEDREDLGFIQADSA